MEYRHQRSRIYGAIVPKRDQLKWLICVAKSGSNPVMVCLTHRVRPALESTR